jgi:hypothetical protein
MEREMLFGGEPPIAVDEIEPHPESRRTELRRHRERRQRSNRRHDRSKVRWSAGGALCGQRRQPDRRKQRQDDPERTTSHNPPPATMSIVAGETEKRKSV